jgi:hypothetical protein
MILFSRAVPPIFTDAGKKIKEELALLVHRASRKSYAWLKT